jgi:hypothetical protein
MMSPSDVFAWTMLIVPMLLVFIRWTHRDVTWWHLLILGAVSSWVLVNLHLRLDPPDNGLANGVNLIFGWIYFLPFLLLFWLLEFLLLAVWKRFHASQFKERVAWLGLRISIFILVVGFGYGLFGWIGESYAIERSRTELVCCGYVPEGEISTSWSWGGWTINYPETEFGKIVLDRQGKMRSIGDP